MLSGRMENTNTLFEKYVASDVMTIQQRKKKRKKNESKTSLSAIRIFYSNFSGHSEFIVSHFEIVVDGIGSITFESL